MLRDLIAPGRFNVFLCNTIHKQAVIIVVRSNEEMASEKPKLTRAGTMKTTAEEGAEFLERQGFDWRSGGSTVVEDDDSVDREKEAEEGAGSPTDAEPSPKRLKRQSTMTATAKEGAEFLHREGYEPDSPEGTPPDQGDQQGTPKVKRDTTMDVTAREGAEFLTRMGGTRERTVMFDDQVTTISPSQPRLQRDSTIDVTVKEGEEFLERMGGTKGKEDIEDGDSEESSEEDESEIPTRAKLQRDSTIDVTVKEGEEFLRRAGALPDDDEKEGDDSDDGGVDEGAETPEEEDEEEGQAPSLKRDTTMKETAKIGEEFIGEEGRAESRSQTKVLRDAEQESEASKTVCAALKRAGTMDVTKAEGEEFLKRKKT